MASDNQGLYPDYPVFKGLQKPLEFLGLQGRYIYWAAGAVGGGILGFLIFYMWIGFIVGLVYLTIVIGFGGAMIFIKQHKGLHSKNIVKAYMYLPTCNSIEADEQVFYF